MSNSSQSLQTIKDVASLLAVSESTVRRLVNDGCLKCYKVRGNLRFMLSDIEAYLNENCLGITSKQ